MAERGRQADRFLIQGPRIEPVACIEGIVKAKIDALLQVRHGNLILLVVPNHVTVLALRAPGIEHPRT